MLGRFIFYSFIALATFVSTKNVAQAADVGKINFYGAVDVGVESIKYGSNSKTGVISSTTWGSYLGVSASHPFDNDFTVGATIEAGVNIDNGRSNSLLEDPETGVFGRQAKIDLDSPWGRLAIGRQYSPYFWLAIMTDPDLLGDYSPTLQVAMGHPLDTWPLGRVSNSVSYKTPTFGGFTAELNYGFDENDTSLTSSETANVMYTNEKIVAGVAWQRQEFTDSHSDLYQIAGSYDFGPFKVYTSYNGLRASTGLHSDGYTLSTSIPFGEHTLFASGSIRDTNVDKDGAKGWLIGYNHQLSKELQLWGRFGNVINDENGDYSLNYINFESDFNKGDDSLGIAVGMLYRFSLL